MSKPSHLERTAHEPRHNDLYSVTIHSIDQPNSTIRIYKLSSEVPIPFLPGQWLDVYCPGIAKAGGFSITSSPHRAAPSCSPDENAPPYVELAVQKSPLNPAAAYLWKPAAEILQTQLSVRVGGSFTFPPPRPDKDGRQRVSKVVLVAGGVGINPVASMADSIVNTGQARSGEQRTEVEILYGSKVDAVSGIEGILFAKRLVSWSRDCGRNKGATIRLKLFLTGVALEKDRKGRLQWEEAEVTQRRMRHDDVLDAVSNGDRAGETLVYICGPPTMTDEFVNVLTESGAIGPERIMSEKWW